MTDRVLSALRVLGIGAPPVASLERDGAFFALLEDTLIYQDAGGTRRVTLRDLTRIHSDQEGLLRVETPAGTAMTASLLGYDPARVQGFFAQVRDATARAKHLPTGPLPAVGGQKTFGPVPPPTLPADGAPPSFGGSQGQEAAPGEVGPAPAALQTAPPVSEPKPARAEPARRPAAPPGPSAARPPTRFSSDADDLGGETVRVIRAGSGAPAEPSAPAVTPPARPSFQPVAVSPAARTVPLPDPEPAPAPSPPAPPPESAPLTVAPAPRPARPARAEALADRAEVVAGLVSRLRLLGAVLGLAALGLAAFQFAGGTGLLGLWTLIAGGVGAIALLTFAEVAGLIAALAREVAGTRTPAAPLPRPESPGDGA